MATGQQWLASCPLDSDGDQVEKAPEYSRDNSEQRTAQPSPPHLAQHLRAMSRTLTKEDDPGMVEVRREDQQRINEFSACNRTMQEFNAEEAVLKTDLQNLQDATDELLLADDDEMVK